VKRKTLEQLRKDALKLGARAAKIIPASTVKTAAWVRRKCQFGCGGYGESLTCPPYSPSPAETREMLKSYKKAILIQIDTDSKASISGIARKLEREAFLAGYWKAFGMGAGPCMICEKCNLKGTCRYGEKARPAMEACGIDVFTTVRANGFPIDTLDSADRKAHYYGLVLVE
jgi:predicted metal-binding protein